MPRILLYPLLLVLIGYGAYHFHITRNQDKIKAEMQSYIQRIDAYKADKGAYPSSLSEAGLKNLFSAGPYNAEIYYQRISGGFWVEFHWGSELLNYTSTTKKFQSKKGG